LTPELLNRPGAEDGMVVPLRRDELARADGTPVSIEGTVIPTGPTDPVAGPPGHEDPASPDGADAGDDVEPGGSEAAENPAEDPAGDGRPPLVTFTPPAAAPPPPPVDAYSFRLVAHRTLYDDGTLVRHAPSMAGLAPGAVLRLHGWDFDRLGIDPGGQVRVSSATASITVAAVPDPAVPKGVAAMAANQPGSPLAELIDVSSPITEIRVETT
jgi:anaerobic selenocysteine-containing dehydrogenase